MSDESSTRPRLPDWFPPEAAAAVRAKYPDGKVKLLRTEFGPVVLRVPTREEILRRHPPRPRSTDAVGKYRDDDNTFDRDRDLVLAVALHPDEATLRKGLALYPLQVAYLSSQAQVLATGALAERAGAPTDMPEQGFKNLELTGARAYQLLIDVDPGRIVVRAPNAVAIQAYDATRASQTPITAAETLVHACLVHPSREELIEIFRKRPLLSVHCAGRLTEWGLGAVEEFQGEL